MRRRLLFFLVIIIFIGCKKASTVSFSTEKFSEKDLKICENDPCSIVTLDYIKASGDDEIAEEINSKIQSYIIEALFLGEDDSPSAKTIEEAARQFILASRDHKNEFEYDLTYEAEVSVSKMFENNNLINLQLQNYLFVGGAHGYGSTVFMNIDKLTGDEIATENLFENYKDFVAFAEKGFREEFEIPKDESINYTGFWFEDDTFSLPDSIGFSKDELIFIYNPYDIASYAEGPIVYGISKKNVTPYLKKEFQ